MYSGTPVAAADCLRSRRLTFERLEWRLALAAPTGNFDAIDPGYFAAGWAYDPDSPNQAITVEFRIDGVTVASQTTPNLRSDVNAALGISGNHGFRWRIPNAYLDGASHTLRIWAIDRQNGSAHQLPNSPKTFANKLPSGNFDGFAEGFFASGWAYDADAPNESITVEYRIDGNTVATQTTPNLRSDVNQAVGITGNHGFFWEIPDQYLDGSTHTLRVFGIDRETGAAYQLSNSPKNFTNALPTGSLESVNSSFQISGWAYDADAKGSEILMQFIVDGGDAHYAWTNVSRPDVNQAFGLSGNHGFTWQIPAQYLDGASHTVRVWAIDPHTAGGRYQIGGSPRTFANTLPIGSVDGIGSQFEVSGWAFDGDVKSASISVQFEIDGSVIDTITTPNLRADVNQTFGLTGNHGFQWIIPQQYRAAGKLVRAYGIDPVTGVRYQIGGSPKSVPNFAPVVTGVAVSDSGAYQGVAFDPNDPDQRIEVEYWIDGQFIQTERTVRNCLGSPCQMELQDSVPPRFLDGLPHTLIVKALDLTGGEATSVSHTFQVFRPDARYTRIYGRTVSGHAVFDHDPSRVLGVQYEVDGQLLGTVAANLPSPWLDDVAGNHAWTLTLPAGLFAAEQGRTVNIYAVNSPTNPTGPRSLIATVPIASPGTLPTLSSRPEAPITFYLDFDGHNESNWNGFASASTPAFDLDGLPAYFSTMEVDYVRAIFDAVAEDFSPFDVNVTTVNPGNFANRAGLRVAIGGDGAWHGSGASAAARLGAFTNSTPNTVFVFTDRLRFPQNNYPWLSVNDYRNIADVISQQIGVALGLQPQSVYSPSGVLVDPYRAGAPDVGPLMGNPLQSKRSRWAVGPSFQSPHVIQDDIAVIIDPNVGPDNGITLRPDDFGNSIAQATMLTMQQLGAGRQGGAPGVIERMSDVDYFAFDVVTGLDYAHIALLADRPAPNLTASFELFDAGGVSLGGDAMSPTDEEPLITRALAPGRYYVAVRGLGGVGNVGQYGITVRNDDSAAYTSPTGGGLGRIELPPPSLPAPVTPAPQAADFNSDGFVDGGDLSRLKSAFGMVGALLGNGDADQNGAVDGADILAWQRAVNSSMSGANLLGMRGAAALSLETIDLALAGWGELPAFDDRVAPAIAWLGAYQAADVRAAADDAALAKRYRPAKRV